MHIQYDIKFGILEVRGNEILLRKWSGGTAHAHLRRSIDGDPPLGREPEVV